MSQYLMKEEENQYCNLVHYKKSNFSVPVWIRVGWDAFKHHRGRSIHQRPVDNVCMAGNPTHVSSGAIHIPILERVVVVFEMHSLIVAMLLHRQSDPPSSQMSGVLSVRHLVNIYRDIVQKRKSLSICACKYILSAIPRCGMHYSFRLSSGP